MAMAGFIYSTISGFFSYLARHEINFFPVGLARHVTRLQKHAVEESLRAVFCLVFLRVESPSCEKTDCD